MKIEKIEGIGLVYAERLSVHGVNTIEKLLAVCAQRKGRQLLAAQSGIPERKLLEWTNRADLMRVKGIGEEYSDLLEAAGVDTVRELALRRPENLYHSVIATNEKSHLVRRPPSLSQIQYWVKQAKELPPVVTY